MIDVAVGVVYRGDVEILIARRPQGVEQGGLWEFPGGKVESGESPRDALTREIAEEIGIQIHHPEPWIRIRHNYPARAVRLIVYRVCKWNGVAAGLEGQEIRWVKRSDIGTFTFPVANDLIKRML